MSPYVQLLYAAMQTRYGIIVEHENPRSARSQFYAARKAHADRALDRISVTLLEDHPTRVYLVKCPDEKKNLLNASTSTSTPATSSGSEPPSATESE